MRTFPIFLYFSAKTDPETETEALGHEKTETEFKIPQPPNTTCASPCLICRPLVTLIDGLIMDVQVSAASALESLCLNNPDCQRAFLELDATAALMQLFAKVCTHYSDNIITIFTINLHFAG